MTQEYCQSYLRCSNKFSLKRRAVPAVTWQVPRKACRQCPSPSACWRIALSHFSLPVSLGMSAVIDISHMTFYRISHFSRYCHYHFRERHTAILY